MRCEREREGEDVATRALRLQDKTKNESAWFASGFSVLVLEVSDAREVCSFEFALEVGCDKCPVRERSGIKDKSARVGCCG